jgi:hypothetical protein
LATSATRWKPDSAFPSAAPLRSRDGADPEGELAEPPGAGRAPGELGLDPVAGVAGRPLEAGPRAPAVVPLVVGRVGELLPAAGREPVPAVLGRDPLLVLGRDPLLVLGRDPLLVLGRDPLLVLGREPAPPELGRGELLLVELGRDPPLERGAERLAELELGRGELEREGAGERLAASSSGDSPQVPPDFSSSHSAVVRIDMTGATTSEDASAACELAAPEHPHGRFPEEPEAY